MKQLNQINQFNQMNINEINNLRQIIIQKDKKIYELKSKLPNEYIKMKDVQLGFQGCKKEVEIIGNNETIEINSYLKSYFTFKTKDSNGIWKGLEFHVFNDKISETTSGYSVLTFYLTYISKINLIVVNF